MKRILSSIAAGLLFFAGAGVTAAQTVVVSPEQETVIREYVTTHEVQPAQIPSDVAVEVGTTLPDTVELHMIDTPDVSVEYRYVVVDGQTVLVEPETREIVQIIE